MPSSVFEKGERFVVRDLQAIDPSELSQQPGIGHEVTVERDSMGFPRVDVYGPSRAVLIEYVRDNWGEDDPEWFAEHVEGRVETVPPIEDDPTFRGYDREGNRVVVGWERPDGSEYLIALTNCCGAAVTCDEDGTIVCKSCYEGPLSSSLATEAVVAWVEPRPCRICHRNQVTSSSWPDVDYCQWCFYGGNFHDETFGPVIARLNEAWPPDELGSFAVWHTGGGCFTIGRVVVPAPDDDHYEDEVSWYIGDGNAGLPDVAEGPWVAYLGTGQDLDGEVHEWLDLSVDKLVDVVREQRELVGASESSPKGG